MTVNRDAVMIVERRNQKMLQDGSDVADASLEVL
jgi:hypothetical protein